MRKINSENPIDDIWQSLLRFSYIDVINKWWGEKDVKEKDNNLASFIASSIKQANSYFLSASKAPINIQPLLFYYGCVSLLIGTLSLVKQKKYEIKNHGMQLDKSTLFLNDIFFIKAVPRNVDGALHIIMQELEGVNDFISHGSWSLLEIFKCLPDLIEELTLIIPGSGVNVLKINEINREERKIDRIPINKREEGMEIVKIIKLDPKFKECYLEPQITDNFVILNRRLGVIPDVEYSIIGESYLRIYYKSKGSIFLPQYISYYIGLYILGTLSRYYPDIWDEFINFDSTGKKNIVRNFLQKSNRYFPNLILNILEGERIQY